MRKNKNLRRVFKYILIDIVIFFIAKYYCATLPVKFQYFFADLIHLLGLLIVLLCIVILCVQFYRSIFVNNYVSTEKKLDNILFRLSFIGWGLFFIGKALVTLSPMV